MSTSTLSSSPLVLVPLESTMILGLRINRVGVAEALDHIEALIERRRQSAGPAHQVATVNAEFVSLARKNATFRAVLNQADLAVADGMGVIWASRILESPLPERVAGVDLLVSLADRCAARGYRLFLLGAAPGVAEEAARRLQQRAPALQIVGTYSGSPAPAEAEHILGRIRDAQPDVLAVAYGAPRQDLWIHQHAQALGEAGVGVAFGVGGAFDFIAGRVRRAPLWMQRAGLEWVFRVLVQPRRIWRLPSQLPIGWFALEQRFRQQG